MSESAPSPSTPDPSNQSPPAPPAPPVFDPNLFPSNHRPFRQWLLDHNPCLLLSTVLMLLGCYLVNSALPDRDNIGKVFALVFVINIYEACIIPLGLALIRRTRGTARDGWWLLLFEALFLVNATFLNVDFRSSWGIPLNLLLFALACVKAAVVMRGLKIGLSLRTFGFFVLQLGCVYGLPIFFALVNVDGIVPPGILYGLWWLVALLPLLYDVIARVEDSRDPAGAPRWDLVQNVIRRVYLIVPWVLLVVHLRYAHWAHDSSFEVANYVPVLLGLVIATVRIPHDHPIRAVAVTILPIVALVLALTSHSSIGIDIGGKLVSFAPIHVTIAATIMTYGYLASPFYFLCSLVAVALGAVGYTFQNWLRAALRWLWRWLIELIPSTPLSWGIAAIGAAFVLLAVGSYISLRRTATPREDLERI